MSVVGSRLIGVSLKGRTLWERHQWSDTLGTDVDERREIGDGIVFGEGDVEDTSCSGPTAEEGDVDHWEPMSPRGFIGARS